MRHRGAVLVSLFLVGCALAPGAVNASSRSCNSQLVSGGICRAAGNLMLYYEGPPAQFQRLLDAIVAGEGYPSEVPCEASRRFVPLANGSASAILVAAGVSAADCVTVGSVVPNPQTPAQFADAVIARDLRNRVIYYENRQVVEAADNPGSVSTPDIDQ